MPIYQFVTEDGEYVEKFMRASEAPDIGQHVEIELEGGGVEWCTRIISTDVSVACDNWKPYVSSRLPRNLPGHPCTKEGKPIVTTKAQERNIMSKFHYERE